MAWSLSYLNHSKNLVVLSPIHCNLTGSLSRKFYPTNQQSLSQCLHEFRSSYIRLEPSLPKLCSLLDNEILRQHTLRWLWYDFFLQEPQCFCFGEGLLFLVCWGCAGQSSTIPLLFSFLMELWNK